MGGRPTRPVRLQPTWSATYKDGLIYINDDQGELECTLSDDIDPMNHHWLEERARFGRELEDWQRFREHQHRAQHLGRVETELELDDTDAGLIEVLTRLSDWEQYRVFHGQIRHDAFNSEDRCRMNFLDITKWEATTKHQRKISIAHDAIGNWFEVFDRSQKKMEAANNQLTWIKSQWPKLIAESVESLSNTPQLQSQLEAKFRKQTHAAFNAIQKLGGRPSHTIIPPEKSEDCLHRILYWTSETSKYKEELLDWKLFLTCRQRDLGDESTMQEQELRCPQFQSASEFSAEFEKFQRFRYDIALTWLVCWQRIVRWYEEESERAHPFYSNVPLDGYAKKARAHVIDSEQKVADAATRLQKAMLEHAHALSEHASDETRIEHSQTAFPPPRPLPDSESPRSSQPSVSSSSPSSSQIMVSIPSPQTSQSSLSSQYPRSPQSLEPPRSPRSSHSSQDSSSPLSPQSPEHLSKDRRLSSKSSSAKKGHRTLKKQNARKGRASMSNTNTNTKQQALPIFSLDPHQAEKGDDVEMTDAAEALSVDATEELQEAGAEFDDIVMTDVDDPLTPSPSSSSSSSQSYPKPVTNAEPEKLPLPNARGPRKTQPTTTRKTRSATKLDQALPNGVPKNKKIGQKPAEKVKAFTEQQVMTLLNAASTSSPSTGSVPLRRSERLKEKDAASKRRT